MGGWDLLIQADGWPLIPVYSTLHTAPISQIFQVCVLAWVSLTAWCFQGYLIDRSFICQRPFRILASCWAPLEMVNGHLHGWGCTVCISGELHFWKQAALGVFFERLLNVEIFTFRFVISRVPALHTHNTNNCISCFKIAFLTEIKKNRIGPIHSFSFQTRSTKSVWGASP